MIKEKIIEMARQAGLFNVSLKIDDKHETLFDMCLLDFAKLIRADYGKLHASLWVKRIDDAVKKERERIKEQNAPEIEKTNAYIKQLELEKMESEILHNEHRKLLGEIKAMTEAARSAEREKCAKFFAENDTNLFWGSQVASHIRARGQE